MPRHASVLESSVEDKARLVKITKTATEEARTARPTTPVASNAAVDGSGMPPVSPTSMPVLACWGSMLSIGGLQWIVQAALSCPVALDFGFFLILISISKSRSSRNFNSRSMENPLKWPRLKAEILG